MTEESQAALFRLWQSLRVDPRFQLKAIEPRPESKDARGYGFGVKVIDSVTEDELLEDCFEFRDAKELIRQISNCQTDDGITRNAADAREART